MRGSSLMLSTSSCGNKVTGGVGGWLWGCDPPPSVTTRPGPHLKLEAAQHDEEDEGEAGEADRQADQALEQQPLPGRVVELLGAGHRADPLHPLTEGTAL